MKKKYFLITALLLFIIGGYFLLFTSKSEININKKLEKVVSVSSEKKSENKTNDLFFDEIKRENIIKVIKKKIPETSNNDTISELIIFDKNENKIGKINLLEENPFLKIKKGVLNLNPFVNTYDDFSIYTSIDKNISYRSIEGELMPDYIGVSFVAISQNEKQISSIIKVFDKKGTLVFNSGIAKNKYFLGPSVSENGKYLAVYSSTYEDKDENFHLQEENKTVFFNLEDGNQIKILNPEVPRDLSPGLFLPNDWFISYAPQGIIALDLKSNIAFIGVRKNGYHLKISKDNEFFFIKNIDKLEALNVTKEFKKHYIN